MATFTFADSYKSAGLAPGPEIIRLRQDAFDKLRKGLDAERAVSLARLYFGLPTKKEPTWFRDAFSEQDPSFSMLENEREVAVLASCLLSAGLIDGVIAAGLAILTIEFGGNRRPLLERCNLISKAKEALQLISIKSRTHGNIGIDKLKDPIKKGDELASELAQQSDFNRVGELLNKSSNYYFTDIKNLTKEVRNILQPILLRLADIEEEVSMLWWHVGGWSRLLERPFSELDPALAATMAGIDLASLITKPPGPVAAQAILHRLISTGRKGKLSKVSIQDMVNAFPTDVYARINLGSRLKDIADICPALTALRLASEIGGENAWQATFYRDVGIDHNTSLLPLDLAMQIYRETHLVSMLD